MSIEYHWMCGNLVEDELLSKCSDLYSTQYGKWSESFGSKAGDSIKLSVDAIKRWFENNNSDLYWACDKGVMIGYAIALRIVTKNGTISWVTQLVVHENYRHRNIAKTILHSIWGFSNHFAWGIVSANPYAIRALEKTTRRRSDPIRIKHNIKKLLNIGIENIPYITSDTEYDIKDGLSAINTCFYVDHSNVDDMIESVVSDTVPWKLGSLKEGWEWIAFTFNDQLPFELSEEEINNLLNSSDKVVHTAYSRMALTPSQKWMNHTVNNVDYILENYNSAPNAKIIDWGCGQGRHAIEFAKRGYNVTAIDYIEKNIENASKNANDSLKITWLYDDCRKVDLHQQFDLALCLYDVVGTYTDVENNLLILKNIFNHLKKGGVAFISVMNRHLTEVNAKNTFILKDEPNKLLSLQPSQTMEQTGDVFNPDYYLLDTDTGIVYRREQFRTGRSLPVELIVRDKRFFDYEIVGLCKSVGFIVNEVRFVNAARWEQSLSPIDHKAKEILIKLSRE
ncbi:MAG: GNAT family N-acetyltransferase [Ruminococcus sp.]|nr:GNAT family N-acetyltransferase [Ruminococcus sp.]